MSKFDEISSKLSRPGRSVNAIVGHLSDEYSRLHCDSDEAIGYAVEKCEGSCIYCGAVLYKTIDGEAFPSYDLNLDHIYPVSYGGLFAKGNIALSCQSCNASKINEDPIEFYSKRLSNGKLCRFKDVSEFEEFLNEYMKPYELSFPEYYALQDKITNSRELSMEDIKGLFIDHLENLTIDSSRTRAVAPKVDQRALKPVSRDPEYDLTYDGSFNLTSLANMSAVSHALLLSILWAAQKTGRINENGLLIVTVPRRIIAVLMGRRIHPDRAVQWLDGLKDLEIDYYNYDGNVEFTKERGSIFESVSYSEGVKDITVEISELMRAKLKPANSNIVTVNLKESNVMNSIYSKELHRLLSQFRNRGKFSMTVEEWRNHFNVDDKYSDNYIKLNQLMPAVESIQRVFPTITSNIYDVEVGLPDIISFEFKE